MEVGFVVLAERRVDVKYLIEGILPANQVHILAGASGAGKTTFLLQYLRDFLDGKPFFGHSTKPCGVAYVGADRQEAEYTEKFSLMDIEAFPLTSIVLDPSYKPRLLSKPEPRNTLLRQMISQFRSVIPDLGLLVIDPISPLLPNKLSDYHEVADALIGLTRLCIEQDITLIGTHHATKLKPDTQFVRPQDRILGSAALLGYSGTHLFLSSPQENKEELYVLTIVPHNAPPETHRLTREKNGRFVVVTDAQGVVEHHALLRLVPNEPNWIDWATLRDKAIEALHISQATLKRRLDQLESDGYIKQPGKGKYQRRRLS